MPCAHRSGQVFPSVSRDAVALKANGTAVSQLLDLEQIETDGIQGVKTFRHLVQP